MVLQPSDSSLPPSLFYDHSGLSTTLWQPLSCAITTTVTLHTGLCRIPFYLFLCRSLCVLVCVSHTSFSLPLCLPFSSLRLPSLRILLYYISKKPHTETTTLRPIAHTPLPFLPPSLDLLSLLTKRQKMDAPTSVPLLLPTPPSLPAFLHQRRQQQRQQPQQLGLYRLEHGLKSEQCA